MTDDLELIADIKAIQLRAGTQGFNEYGVPLHAFNGYIQDSHYWAWVHEHVVTQAVNGRPSAAWQLRERPQK